MTGQKPIEKRSLLIVDDDRAIHNLLRTMLEPAGWEVASATSGSEALDLLSKTRFDLVLTDLVMPGMDGLELLDRIHVTNPAMPMVVMTAANTPGNVVQSIRRHAFSYLGKPFSRETALTTLDAALEHGSDCDDIVIGSARPDWVSLEVRCKMVTADRLTQFFREMICDLEDAERESVSTAFRELLMNAIEHGGKSDPRQKVNLTYIRAARSIIYYIRDPGQGFSFDKLAHAAVANTPDQPFEHSEVRKKLGIRPGGFGILLTRNFADEVIYSEKGNEVVLIKYLAG